MRMTNEGRIILDLDETVEVGHITVQEDNELDSEVDLTKAPKASGEFIPKSFFDSVAVYKTSCSESDDDETNKELSVPLKRDDKVLTVLEVLPVHMRWQQIFHLPEEMHEQIVIVIRRAELYAEKLKDASLTRSSVHCATCNTVVAFTDDDLLFGSKPHNHLFFITGYIRGQMVNRILVDGGSVVNIMPKSTMNDLGITIGEFSKS